MTRSGPLLAAAVVTLLASGCASAGGGGSCKFAYTDEFRTAIVQPELKRAFAAGWNNWKIEDPSIFEAHGRAQILLHLRDEVNYLDPPEYKLVVDSCGRKLISAGKCYLPGTGAPEC
ncbi:MAG TPA: hypothetical protein VHW05_06125 [Phenylobacterium sp.]|jgi:hypothetical protein|nr:hypothetical protein [Phenylobacterium sp.]